MPSRSDSRKSSASHRSTLSLTKTEITIHVYDLLPPGRLSSVLWTVGAGLLHTGVVINGREYAYGGHERRGVTGVYWTKPKTEPPGGRWRCALLHGFCFAGPDEIDRILREASEAFLGTSYNLLTKNCNHFTQHLCRRLTGRAGPGWLNRAASIGVALPCVVPRDWVEPPEYETAEGELLEEEMMMGEPGKYGGRGSGEYDDDDDDDDDDELADERAGMLRPPAPRLLGEARRSRAPDDGATTTSMTTRSSDAWDSEEERQHGGSGKGKGKGKKTLRDTDGRTLPPAERAPQ